MSGKASSNNGSGSRSNNGSGKSSGIRYSGYSNTYCSTDTSSGNSGSRSMSKLFNPNTITRRLSDI